MGLEKTNESKRMLLEALRKGKSNKSIFSGLPRRPERYEFIPLSSEQKRMWMFWADNKETTIFHLTDFFSIRGYINVARLEEVINEVVNEYDVFKFTFHYVHEKVVIREEDKALLDYRYLERKTEALKQCRTICDEPFDLENGPLVRAVVVKSNGDELTLGIAMHHIISDGWSINIFLSRIIEKYYETNELHHKKAIGFIDYLFYRQQEEYKQALEKDMQYWREKLIEPVKALRFPTMLNKTNENQYVSTMLTVTVEQKIYDKINQFCLKTGVTKYQYFLSVFYTLVHNLLGVNQLCVGTPIANRTYRELENEIGYFTNTLPVFLQSEGSITGEELLEYVKTSVVNDFQHQKAGLDEILADRKLFFKDSKLELFNGLFAFHNFPDVNDRMSGCTITPYQHEVSEQQMDYSIAIVEGHDEFIIELKYRKDYLEEQSAVILLEFYKELCSRFIESLSQKVDTILPLNQEDCMKNTERLSIRPDIERKCIPVQTLFEQQALKTPDRLAVITEEASVTYEELNKQAAWIAALLKKANVQSGDICAVYLKRGIRFVAAMYGILKAHAQFVLIDDRYPIDRIRYMLDKCHAKIILTSNEEVRVCNEQNFDCRIINLDEEDGGESPEYLSTPYEIRYDTGAYLVFTSGTTGVPKGIQGTHLGLLNHNLDTVEEFGLTQSDRTIHFSALGFDATLEEIMPTLTVGGCIVVRNDEVMESFDAFTEYIENNQISVVGIPAAYWEKWVLHLHETGGKIPRSVRVITLSGQRISPSILQKWNECGFENIKLINTYGPSEASITTTTCIYRRPDDLKIEREFPMGHPWRNYKLRIINENHHDICPLGIGELYIGGIGVGLGYYEEEELTQKSFVMLTENGKEERYFKTGDLVSVLPSGELLFIGRKDAQIKIRGNRVEVEEIRKVLLRNEEVRECVISAESFAGQDTMLVAYVTGNIKDSSVSDLRYYLENYLPNYMIPSIFVKIDEVPVTVNGKVDLNKLREIQKEISREQEIVEPENEMQRQLLDIINQVLGVTVPGIHASFFEYGGDSLKAIQLIKQIQDCFGIKLRLADIFNCPTVHMLSEKICDMPLSVVQEEVIPIEPIEAEYAPLTPMQKQIYIIQSKNEESVNYNMPMVQVLKEKINIQQLQVAVNETIEANEVLRTVFVNDQGTIRQRILSDLKIHITEFSCRVNNLQDLLNSLVLPFSLASGPLVRMSVIHLDSDKDAVFLDVHHIICDGTSLLYLFQELLARYNHQEWNSPLIQYKDYAYWLEKKMQDELGRQFWKNYLEGQNYKLDLPHDGIRKADTKGSGKQLEFFVDKDKVSAWKKRADEHNVTDHFILFSVFAAVLHKLSDTQQFFIGSLVSDRDLPQLERVLGLFINFLPIKVDFSGTTYLSEVIQNITVEMLNCLEHKDINFSEIVEQSSWKGDFWQNPIFDTMCIFHNEIQNASMLNEEDESGEQTIENGSHKLDLKIDIFSNGAQYKILTEYDSNLFSENTIALFKDLFIRIVNDIDCIQERKLDEITETSVDQKLLIRSKREASMVKQEIAVSSSCTLDVVADYINIWSERFHIHTNVTYAPYNQVMQQLVNPDSIVNTCEGVVFVCQRLEDWIRDTDADEIEKDRLLHTFAEQYIKALKEAVPAGNVYIVFLPVSDYQLTDFLKDKIYHIYERVQAEIQSMNQYEIMDLRNIASEYEVPGLFDADTDKIAHIPYTQNSFVTIGMCFTRGIVGVTRRIFKVVAVDCDNTLWKGICAEDQKVEVTKSHQYLQQFLLKLKEKGYLLVICSKNREDDVWKVFEENPNMRLAKDDFVAWRINWNRKSENLLSMADELNLGIDSFIFIDDSQAECLEVQNAQPSVLTLLLPEQEEEIQSFLHNCWAFDTPFQQNAAQSRSELYKAEKRRNVSRRMTDSQEEYLKMLDLELAFCTMREEEISRISELTYRTNQFNMSSLRKSKAEIGKLERNNIFTVKVKDKFGDYGISGGVIVEDRADSIYLETFLLSCRVLGRNIEYAVVDCLKSLARERGKTAIEGKFVRSEKNEPMERFLSEICHMKEDGSFRLSLDEGQKEIPYVKIRYQEDFQGMECVEEISQGIGYHHVGIAVSDMDQMMDELKAFGYECEHRVFDPIQQSELAMLVHPNAPDIELIGADKEESRARFFVEHNNRMPYHICLQVASLEQLDHRLKEAEFLQAKEITKAEPAILFGGDRVKFYSIAGFGLVEFVERTRKKTYTEKPEGAVQILLAAAKSDILAAFLSIIGGKVISEDSECTQIRIGHATFSILPKSTLRVRNRGNIFMVSNLYESKSPEAKEISLMSEQYDSNEQHPYFVYRHKRNQESLVMSSWNMDLSNVCGLLHRPYYYSLQYMNNSQQVNFVSEYQPKKKYRLTGNVIQPRNQTERIICDIWKDVLQVDLISMDDTFYDLGGFSLSAVELVNQMNHALGATLTLTDIFSLKTIEKIALKINEKTADKIPEMKIEEEKWYKASSSQKRMFLLHAMEPDALYYSLPLLIEINQKIDEARINRALSKIIENNVILRTVFRVEEGEVQQKVLHNFSVNIEILEAEELELKDIVQQFIRPYDLENGPLFRIGYLKKGDKYYLIMDFHHIIMDGVSTVLLLKDMFRLYYGGEIKKTNYDYIQYAMMEEQHIQNHSWDEARDYWMNQLADFGSNLELPYDKKRMNERTYEGSFISEISKFTKAELEKCLNQLGITPYSFFLTAFYVLLEKYTMSHDLTICSPFANRYLAEFYTVYGSFINTLPLRFQLDMKKTVKQVLLEVFDMTQKALKYEYYPYEILLDELDINRSSTRNQFFDIIFRFNDFNVMFEGENEEFKLVDIEGVTSELDMDFLIEPHEDHYRYKIIYATELFEENTITQMMGHYEIILSYLLTHLNDKLSDLEMLSTQQIHTIDSFSDFSLELPDVSIPELIERKAYEVPQETAIIFDGGTWNYETLIRTAHRIAFRIMSEKLEPENVVALYMERNPYMAASILGIWMAGLAYVPIEINTPLERIKVIQEQSEFPLLITMKQWESEITGKLEHCTLICADEIAEHPHEKNSLEFKLNLRSLAYVIFTSGSTGKPKGAMVEHLGMLNHIVSKCKIMDFCPESIMIQNSSQCFDISVLQFFMPLVTGASTRIVTRETQFNLKDFVSIIQNDKVTHLEVVPSFLSVLADYMKENNVELNTLENIIVTGEAVKCRVLKQWFEVSQVKVINAYGPTEASDDIAHYIMTEAPADDPVPVGKPIFNSRIYILDENLKRCPVKVQGEIYVSGICVGRGYIKEPEKTSMAFIPNPYSENEDDRILYKTGDLGRWFPDGTIEFIGRVDYQVKVRGFRIELGEIESALTSNKDITDAVAVIQKNKEDDMIAAYVQSNVADKEELRSTILNVLKEKLPYYMIPDYIEIMEKLPLNSNGKIDRKALPSVEFTRLKEEITTDMELIIANIVKSVLKLDGKIYRNDDIFQLGANSIKVISIISKLQNILGKTVSFKYILSNPTIRGIAEGLNESEEDEVPVSKYAYNNDYILFCIPPIAGWRVIYNKLPELLKAGRIYLFDFIEEDRIEKYANYMLEQLDGKEWTIMGYSAGGNLAMEIAAYLEQQNCAPGKVILFDSNISEENSNPTPEELEEEVKESMEEGIDQFKLVDQNIELTPELFELAYRKRYKYSEYFYYEQNLTQIKSEVYWIAQSEYLEGEQEKIVSKWKEIMREREIHVLQGHGRHANMFFDPYIEKNVEILRNILEKK
nr:non-ribosomal peptide synthetase [uncultured Lachnoclostridium sp.]